MVAPQGQAFLLVLLTSILLASVFNVRNRGGNSSGLVQQTLNRLGRCEWGGLARLCRDSCGSCCGRHYYPWAGGGELLLIHDVGAYGAAMASCYNSRPLPAEVVIRPDGSAALARPALDPNQLLALEKEALA